MSSKIGVMGEVSKAVIPAAGLVTRLLSATREQPKEVLPLFASDGGTLCLKPAVQQIFEQLSLSLEITKNVPKVWMERSI